jgi:SAM-dependent methyltransferase/uncharacterized protein YbaR (Trm112 family)
MNDWILKMLRCPLCRNPVLSSGSSDANPALALSCNQCGSLYPIVDGIPRMMVTTPGTAGEIARSFGFQWRVRAQGWFEHSTLYGLSSDEERRNFFDRLGISPEELAGKTILDAGCGDGFLLSILGQFSARVVGIDINSAIAIPHRRCRDFSNVAIIQADILTPPFSLESFDYVWCEGVLVCTDEPQKAFRALSDLVKPGGRLYVWVYPSERLSIYQRIRDLLRVAHHLPRPLLLPLCYVLAIPLALAQRLLARRERIESVQTIAFGLFDNLSPRVQSRHSVAEVRGWFEEQEFTNLKQTDLIGMSGLKVGSVYNREGGGVSNRPGTSSSRSDHGDYYRSPT